jgi:hypothetical protein
MEYKEHYNDDFPTTRLYCSPEVKRNGSTSERNVLFESIACTFGGFAVT